MEIVWSESFFKRRTITINFSLYSLCLYLFNWLNYICWFNRFECVFFVLFFCLLLHSLAVKISLTFYDCLPIIIVLIQVYNWQIWHHSMICCCGRADILFLFQFCPWFKFYFPLFQTHHHTLSYPKTKYNKI